MIRNAIKAKRKRPIGIAILAAAQMCIGFGGLLTLPIISYPIWLSSTRAWVHAHPFLVAGEVGFLAIYAGIALGLWKLLAWARMADIGLILVCALRCIWGIWSIRPLEIMRSFVAWYVVGFGCILWYLMLPRVRSAFESSSNDESAVAAGESAKA